MPPKLCDQGRGRKRIQHVVKAGITQREVQRVVKNSQWPARPFWRVAKQVGLAEIRETFISVFDKVRKAIAQIELLENPGQALGERFDNLRQLLRQRGREPDEHSRQQITNMIEEEREATGILALQNLKSLQKLEGAPRVKKALELLRKYIPKYFFKAVNRQLSFNQGQ